MDPKKQIRQLLEGATDPNVVFVLFDLLEEHGWDPALVDLATERLLLLNADQQGEQVTIIEREPWARLLGVLAKTDYPLAVKRMNRVQLSERDYHSHALFVDAVNTARAAESRGWPANTTWQERIEMEQMAAVTGEDSLERWQVIDAEGRETSRRWTIDYAPEGMEYEFQDEFGFGASFKTVWYSDGGNFGPSFDESLRDTQGLWRSVRQFAAGREPECPWLGTDPDNVEVALEATYGGEAPGMRCALCDADLGQEHGVVYLGELGGTVFLLDVASTVTDIEIVQDGDRWEIFAFNGDEEIELPLNPGARLRTAEAARAFISDHQGTEPGDLSPTVQVHVVPEEAEED